MIHCKRHLIAAGFMFLLPLTARSEAPVFDESDNFAIRDGLQAQEAPVGDYKYDEPQMGRAQNNKYRVDDGYPNDDGPALAKDDQVSNSKTNVKDNAALIDKIQNLQQEVQELRGQLEIQAHDLKLLQQQQVAFYKDLDARLGTNASAKTASGKSSIDLSLSDKATASPVSAPAVQPVVTKPEATLPAPADVTPVSRVNPADEQISYLAAYELVKNKRYDDALNSMNIFVQKYPKGGYTANAHYWLGELYLIKKDYTKAREHFDVVLQQFPTSSKSAASMLKVGYVYAAMGQKTEAKKFLQQVVRAYPDTPTAQLASAKLRTI